MKKLIIILTLGISTLSFSQKVTVDKKSEKIKGESAEGYAAELDGKKEDIAAALGRLIKDLGKVKSGREYQYVEGPALGGTVYTTGIVYAKSRGNEEKSSVWLGIKAAEWTVNDITLVEKQLEKLVYQFGVKFYRDKIQAQIDEGQQALDAVARQQQRLCTFDAVGLSCVARPAPNTWTWPRHAPIPPSAAVVSVRHCGQPCVRGQIHSRGFSRRDHSIARQAAALNRARARGLICTATLQAATAACPSKSHRRY